jgi:hypothetical protein
LCFETSRDQRRRLAHGAPVGGELDYLDEGTLGGHAQPNGFVTEYPGDPEFVETKMTTLLSVLAIWTPTCFPELNIY